MKSFEFEKTICNEQDESKKFYLGRCNYIRTAIFKNQFKA